MIRESERIAAAPTSWGVSEVPGWGRQLPSALVLADMRALGLTASEAGPHGFLPDDAGELRDVLAAYDIALASGFTPLVLHGGEMRWRRDLTAVARRFAAAGATIVVVAAVSGADGYDARPELSMSDWRRLLHALDSARELAAEHGLEIAFHPHHGTMVATPGEISRVLDGSSVPLCLDTGHVVLGGGDPAQLAEQAPERIAHLHLKDVDAGLASKVRGGELSFREAVGSGVFWPLGDGDVDIRAVLDHVRAAGYAGWYVFEQDARLSRADDAGRPRHDVARSLAFLRRALAGAAS